MSGTLQPLDQKFAIVDQYGNPTDYFTRWAQQRQIDIGDSITLADLQAYLDAHVIVAGVGIQFAPGPNGDLNKNPTIHADAQAILDEITATRGSILYRGLLGWAGLVPGTAGYVLSTNGAGADPTWVAQSGGGGGGSTPTVRSFNQASSSWASINVPFPAGTVAGDVVVVFAENGFQGVAFPTTWTPLNNVNVNWTNFTCAAKVMTAGDIATGFVTVTTTGNYNGYYSAVCLTGTTVKTLDQSVGTGSGGSGSVATWPVNGLPGISSTDLVVGFFATRGTMTPTFSAGLTLLTPALNAANASGAVFTVNAAAIGKLGINELATLPVGNNGGCMSLVAFKGP